MRKPRRKLKNQSCYYHLYNRISGFEGEYPFTDEDKGYAVYLLKELSKYYLIEVIEYVIMGNHFHVVVNAPDRALSPEEAIARHEKHRKTKIPNDCNPEDRDRIGKKIAMNQIDISHFMQSFQQRFTIYFNKVHHRRGSLWGGRFKSTILLGKKAVWDCVKYLILNPLKCSLSINPAEYAFSAWGEYKMKGYQPFYKNISIHLDVNSFFNGKFSKNNSSLVSLDSFIEKEIIKYESDKRNSKRLRKNYSESDHQADNMLETFWIDGIAVGEIQQIEQFSLDPDDYRRFLRLKKPFFKGTDGNLLYHFSSRK